MEWPRPEGRVETYLVRWRESSNPNVVNKRNVSQNLNGTGPVRLLVGDLMPGEEYIFDIQAISNSLESDVTVLRTRTSKKIYDFTLLCYLEIFKINILLAYSYYVLFLF